MQKQFDSEQYAMSFPVVGDFPVLPANAHNATAVSLTEFCQHPFSPCENNSHDFAFVTCSDDESPRDVIAIEVS